MIDILQFGEAESLVQSPQAEGTFRLQGKPKMQKYRVIYADPPWTFSTYSDKGKGRSAESYYDCMSLDDIKRLPVQDLADTDCVLFMWITDPLLFQAKEVIEAWGFIYKTVGFYWMKTKQDVPIDSDVYPYTNQDFPIGTGYWTRANPEQCLLATRGKPHAREHNVRRLVISPRREHSRKPDEIYDRIEHLVIGPYVELFARFEQHGWDTAFSTLEGSVERRWKSNEGRPSIIKDQEEKPPIDVNSFIS